MKCDLSNDNQMSTKSTCISSDAFKRKKLAFTTASLIFQFTFNFQDFTNTEKQTILLFAVHNKYSVAWQMKLLVSSIET